jgi:hypothetical protein
MWLATQIARLSSGTSGLRVFADTGGRWHLPRKMDTGHAMFQRMPMSSFLEVRLSGSVETLFRSAPLYHGSMWGESIHTVGSRRAPMLEPRAAMGLDGFAATMNSSMV